MNHGGPHLMRALSIHQMNHVGRALSSDESRRCSPPVQGLGWVFASKKERKKACVWVILSISDTRKKKACVVVCVWACVCPCVWAYTVILCVCLGQHSGTLGEFTLPKTCSVEWAPPSHTQWDAKEPYLSAKEPSISTKEAYMYVICVATL